MSRRRRQKNKMLPRIFAVAVLVNCAAVLVAAQFGAFKAIQREFGASKVILIAPAEAPKEKEKPTQKVKKAEPKARAAKKSDGAPAKGKSAPKNALSQPKVVTGTGGAGNGNGAVAAPGGNLNPGSLPTVGGGGPAKPKPEPTSTPKPAPTPQPQPKPQLQPKVERTPEAKPIPVPVFIDCEPIDQPQPAIPDDLRMDALSKDYVADFEVGPDGVPISVKTVQSTGIDELDRVALDAARKWKFKPATLGGVATTQTVRLKIEFRVQ